MSWLQRINRLSQTEKEGLYRILIPPSLYHRFFIDPLSFCEKSGQKAIRFFCPKGDMTAFVEVKLPDVEDPVFSIQVTDSGDITQIELEFVIANHPDPPKFNVHIDDQGRDTLFGWASRNMAEEIKAMEAGLFPGQVRKGLGLTREVIMVLEFFCRIFDKKTIRLEALFYHNAITYERYGFAYFGGFHQMKRIHDLFQPGGKLFEKLDNSTPFRRPEFASNVRGRSWAIHDGILLDIDDEVLDQGWVSPAMYRMVGNPRGMITFPNPIY